MSNKIIDIGGEKTWLLFKKNSIKFKEYLLNNFAIINDIFTDNLKDLNEEVYLDIENVSGRKRKEW